MAKIERQISNIRDLINKPRKQHLLLRDKEFWNQLCSSLDVLQDTDLALDSYLEKDFPEETGEKYLRIYGLLQSLIVQQDAVDHLIESLSLSMPKASARLKDIREIRIKSIGHPTKKGRGKEEETYHFISRMTMHKNGFQLMSCSQSNPFEFTDVKIPALIAEQRSVIEEMLKTVIAELKKEEKQHKEKFKNEKLADLFPNILSYVISKIYEGVNSETPHFLLAASHLETIEKTLDSFRQALGKRDLWEASEGIRYIYEELEYPLSELNKYFKKEDGSESADKKAEIFLFFVEKKIEELEEIAKEIDEDYNK